MPGRTVKSGRPKIEEYSDHDSESEKASNGDEDIDHEYASGSQSNSDESEDDDNDATARNQLSHVSFGSLSKAQDALGSHNERKRKRGVDMSEDQKSKLATMRARLQELRERKETVRAGDGIMFGQSSASKTKQEDARPRKDDFFSNDNNDDDSANNSEDDSDSDGPGEVGPKREKRSSKHAPTAMPANRAVGRYREVVDVPKIKPRDPRFDVTSGNLDRNAVQSRYSFLNDYQSSELTELKKALKNPKAKLSDEQRDKLQRKAVSIESKIAANKAKEREEKVRREHRTKEREAVAQGKKPFYLKRSDVKKQALVDRFEGMKSRQKDKVIQRRRKKMTAKERKNMPMDRRA